ncbi:MAG: hypothetical protein HOP30_09470 [Cyclobacteriaceae bacterium]|nr:hypothetical protein [Cyclobacteriaceae bacterium]
MKTIIVAFTVIASFTFFGCSTNSVEPAIKNEINISRSSITLGALQLSTDTFKISSNINWEIISGASWLEVAKRTGKGDTILSVLANEPNRYNTDRSAKLFIRSKKDSISKVITIIQEGSYVPTLLAGDGSLDFSEGTGASASFNNLKGIAVDLNGNAYVADMNNQRIRSIEWPTGKTSTLAGNGILGNIDGTITSATLYNPYDLTLDEYGNIYFTSSSGTVRKIAKDGSVSVFSDGGNSFYANDKFRGVTGIVYSLGYLYVADFGRNEIRKISMDGEGTTIAGSGKSGFDDGISTKATFNYPNDLAVGPNGEIYVADGWNIALRKITRDGVVTTVAGDGTQGFRDGHVKQAKFEYVTSVAVSNKNLIFVADGDKIRKIDADGNVRTIGINGRPFILPVNGNRVISSIECWGDRLYVTLQSGSVYILDK